MLKQNTLNYCKKSPYSNNYQYPKNNYRNETIKIINSVLRTHTILLHL